MSARTLGPREMARQTGVSTDTLRHYERLKLLPAPDRTAAGYRRYSPDAVNRVLMIQRALVVGFSLGDLGRVLKERDKGGAPCRQVRGLVGDRLVDLDTRIRELLTLRRDLKRLVRDWDTRLAATPAGQRAHLLDTLVNLRPSPPIRHSPSPPRSGAPWRSRDARRRRLR